MDHLEEEEELTGWAEHERDTTGPEGDPRHCPHHPHIQTSDPFGQFDAPCGECEAADAAYREDEDLHHRPTLPPTPEYEEAIESHLPLDQMIAKLLKQHIAEEELDLPALKEPQ